MIRTFHPQNPELKVEAQLLEFYYEETEDILDLKFKIRDTDQIVSTSFSFWSTQVLADHHITHTGRAGAGTYSGHVDCETKAEAELFRLQYLRNYNPAGYGTRCGTPQEVHGKYRVSVYRAGSCD